jgi:hydrogenase/urease accessory protein HupE
VLGGLAALDRRLSPTVVAAVAMAVGLVHGWRNGVGIATDQRELTGIVAIAATPFVLTALVSALVVSDRKSAV